MKRILLIALGCSICVWADFTRDDTNGIVIDNTANLQWQDDATPGTGDEKKWTDAIDYCENLDLNGTDWRIPNINELETLVDDGRYNSAIVSIFKHTNPHSYWSSTSVNAAPKLAQTIIFYSGTMKGFDKNETQGKITVNGKEVNIHHYVRCVRDN